VKKRPGKGHFTILFTIPYTVNPTGQVFIVGLDKFETELIRMGMPDPYAIGNGSDRLGIPLATSKY
jgi:hypothetical protein